MFSAATIQNDEQEILHYFEENVGIRSNDTELRGYIDLFSSEGIREKYIQIFEDNDVPFKVKPCTKAIPSLFSSFLESEEESHPEDEIHPEHEIHYVLMNLPDWLNKSDEIKKKLRKVLLDSNGLVYPSWNQSLSYHHIDDDDNKFDLDDPLVQRINGYHLIETTYDHLCISIEDISDFEIICRDNNFTLPFFHYAKNDKSWGYYTFVDKKIWQNVEWKTCSDDIKAVEYERLLKKNFIPFFRVRDHHGKLTVSSCIIPQKTKAKFRQDIGIAQRSSWEANIARVLNYCGVSWEYEREPFEVSDELNYLPDFFIGENTILEVKGFWDAESRKKVTAFQKGHPEYKCLILDADMYPTLRAKYKTVIPEWEDDGKKIVQSETIPVVGIKFCASAVTLKKLKIGDRVLFKREPENKYDKYAVLATNEQGAPIGHIGSEWSFIYGLKLDLGMVYEGNVKEITEKVIQIKISRINVDENILYDFLK